MKKTKKNLNIKKSKLMKRRRKRTFLFLALILIISLSFLARKAYLNIKCKDLYYATQYYMCSYPFNKEKLKNVRSMDLVFSDNNSAIVEVKGVKPKPPRKLTIYKAKFYKTKFNSWKLENVTELN